MAYAHTYSRDLHKEMYGFTNMRLLTVTKGRQRIEGIQAAHREYTWDVCSPKVLLFADRPSILSGDILGNLWVDGANERQSLVD